MKEMTNVADGKDPFHSYERSNNPEVFYIQS